MSAAISFNFDECSRAWWLQNSSSPPEGSTARTRAAALHRSQRSEAVNSGRVSVLVMASPSVVPDLCDQAGSNRLRYSREPPVDPDIGSHGPTVADERGPRCVPDVTIVCLELVPHPARSHARVSQDRVMDTPSNRVRHRNVPAPRLFVAGGSTMTSAPRLRWWRFTGSDQQGWLHASLATGMVSWANGWGGRAWSMGGRWPRTWRLTASSG